MLYRAGGVQIKLQIDDGLVRVLCRISVCVCCVVFKRGERRRTIDAKSRISTSHQKPINRHPLERESITLSDWGDPLRARAKLPNISLLTQLVFCAESPETQPSLVWLCDPPTRGHVFFHSEPQLSVIILHRAPSITLLGVNWVLQLKVLFFNFPSESILSNCNSLFAVFV